MVMALLANEFRSRRDAHLPDRFSLQDLEQPSSTCFPPTPYSPSSSFLFFFIGNYYYTFHPSRYAATHRATAEENNGGILVQEVKRKEGGSRRGSEEAKEEKGRSFYLGPGSSDKVDVRISFRGWSVEKLRLQKLVWFSRQKKQLR
ncbi:hypothetical protein V1477_006765, partial [Vespula maculifrons]